MTAFAAMAGIAFACGAGVSALAQQAAPPPANLFQDQAGKLGARKCASLYAALGRGMTQGAAYTLKTETSKEAPDAHIVQGVVGMAYNLPDLKGPAGGIVLATPMPKGCEGYMIRVAPFQKPCAEVLRLLPAGSVEEQRLSGVPQYRLGGNQGQALVIPNGSTCVVVTLAGMAQPG
ncbi:MAG: hypothetical protein MT490_14425 [Sphingomonas sp.]|uniref:hypothetical protein n=1 Tax=Sphingomonas sp. TaxID=28214 RepID=UPI002276EFA1|nr:hypothetical protein [Sphingomonas sp.]MCX8476984.1 hypothetical protein [Sphingomonas sp.]